MTQKALKSLAVLRAATVKYSPRVEKKLGKGTASPVVESASKYYVALKKLAAK